MTTEPIQQPKRRPWFALSVIAILSIIAATLVIVTAITFVAQDSRDRTSACEAKANARFDNAVAELIIGSGHPPNAPLESKGLLDLRASQTALIAC